MGILLTDKDANKENIYNLYSSSCFLYNPSAKRRYAIEIPKVLVDAKIRYSRYGWILLSKSSSDSLRLFFFSYCSFNDKTIELPALTKEYSQDERLVFSERPNSSTDCLVFSVRCRIRMKKLCISTCCPSDKTSDKTRTSYIFESSYREIHGLACFKGLLYCVFSENWMVFNPEKKKLKKLPLNIILPPILKGVTPNRLIASEFDEKLLMIYFDINRPYIRVSELDSLKKKWIEIEKLTDKLLFLCYTDSLSVPKASKLANTVNFKSGGSFSSYFPRRSKLLQASNAQIHFGWIEPRAMVEK